MVYVPSHLYHMVFELFKVISFSLHINHYLQCTSWHFLLSISVFDFFQNAMRATMELYGDALDYPPIQAQVALGDEDLTIKVQSCFPGFHE